MISAPRVGLILPTLNAGARWSECLNSIKSQSLRPTRLLIVDSESTDGTVELAKAAGFEVIRIARSQFNHGGTRQWAAEYLADCELLIFLTQDAIPADSEAFAEIASCFEDDTVAVAYGRQLPHLNATPIEAHARVYNYEEQSLKKDARSAQQIGTKVFFCSNSFAAYRRAVLLELGGFRRDLILGEDMEFAARAIEAGYANYYNANACVRHSHAYSLSHSVRRYFDIGAFEYENEWMRTQFGSHSGEGLRFVKSEFLYLWRHAPWHIPYASALTAAKLLGYKLGQIQVKLPRSVKRKLSMQPSFWSDVDVP